MKSATTLLLFWRCLAVVRAASFCRKLHENFGAASCSDLSSTSFRLEAGAGGCLTYLGHTFDDQGEGDDDTTAQNVCRLALYGNKAPRYERPARTTSDCRLRVAESSETEPAPVMSHWFGRCSVGGCSTCTNHALLAPRQDCWRNFTVGDSCFEDDGDTDRCTGQAECSFDLAPTPAPSISAAPSVTVRFIPCLLAFARRVIHRGSSPIPSSAIIPRLSARSRHSSLMDHHRQS